MNDIHKIRVFMGKSVMVHVSIWSFDFLYFISLFPFEGDVDKRLVYLSHLREL